jgi:hypothetical protein
MRELIMGSRAYQLVNTNVDYASSVVKKKRCGILIEFSAYSKTHMHALHALKDADCDIGDCNYEVHLRVTCEQCQRSLTTQGIGMLFMSQDPSIVGFGGFGDGIGIQRMKRGGCPSCGHTHCYLLYDPDGF